MKIFIATGLTGGDVGGPSQYPINLAREFSALGHLVKVSSYGWEKKLPIGLRHLIFFLKILPRVLWADCVLALDTFSVGVPSVFAARLLGKRAVVRVGGDFLWEAYVNRTGEKIILKNFYTQLHRLNFKEKVIFHLTKALVRRADVLVFNTAWFRDIWISPYEMFMDKVQVIYHPISERVESMDHHRKNFLWAGRENKVKNLEWLRQVAEDVSIKHKEFSLDVVTGAPHAEVLERIKDAYALILPSLSDTCPLFIIEGITSGKPFIMTKETGLKEVCDRGGVFIDPLSKEELVVAIEKMLDSAEYEKYKNELRLAGRARSWREVTKEFEQACSQTS